MDCREIQNFDKAIASKQDFDQNKSDPSPLLAENTAEGFIRRFSVMWQCRRNLKVLEVVRAESLRANVPYSSRTFHHTLSRSICSLFGSFWAEVYLGSSDANPKAVGLSPLPRGSATVNAGLL